MPYPYPSRSVFFWGVFLFISDHDNMCSETDFTHERKSFSSNFLNPQFFLTVHCSCHGQSRIAVKWRRKGHEKCIFETPHNEIKCVLSIKELNFNDKRIKIFTSGPTGLTPPPPLPLRSALPKNIRFFMPRLTKNKNESPVVYLPGNMRGMTQFEFCVPKAFHLCPL